jgi:hypothetical protein
VAWVSLKWHLFSQKILEIILCNSQKTEMGQRSCKEYTNCSQKKLNSSNIPEVSPIKNFVKIQTFKNKKQREEFSLLKIDTLLQCLVLHFQFPSFHIKLEIVISLRPPIVVSPFSLIFWLMKNSKNFRRC